MLAFAYFSHHIEGAIHFMAPLTILFFINVGIFLWIFIKKNYDSIMMDVLKQVGILIFMYGVFGTLVGFLQMFDALEAMNETLPLAVISGGVKVALLNVLYGAGYFCLSHSGYIILRMLSKNKVVA